MARGAEKTQQIFTWSGTDRHGNKVTGEIEAQGPAYVRSTLRREGINPFAAQCASNIGRSLRFYFTGHFIAVPVGSGPGEDLLGLFGASRHGFSYLSPEGFPQDW